MTQKALYELDQDKREKLLFQAYGEAMKDLASIPLHWQVNVWASRPGIRYEARKDEQTVAEGAYSASAIVERARAGGIEMPIAAAVDAIVNRQASIDDAIDGLLSRPFKVEGCDQTVA